MKNFSILPSERDLAAVETELGRKENYLAQLRNCLAPLKRRQV